MAKKNKIGRPKGSEKKALNIYLQGVMIDKLKDLAIEEKRTISAMVENALETAYGI